MSTSNRKRLLMFIIAVISIGAISIWYCNKQYFITVPTPTFPSPNAYEALSKANSYIYQGEKSEALSLNKMNNYQKMVLLNKNRKALDIARRSFGYDYREPLIRGYEVELPYLRKYRYINNLFLLEGDIYKSEYKYRLALNSYIDGLFIGHLISRHTIISTYEDSLYLQEKARTKISPHYS